jgi:hypothetical protein
MSSEVASPGIMALLENDDGNVCKPHHIELNKVPQNKIKPT